MQGWSINKLGINSFRGAFRTSKDLVDNNHINFFLLTWFDLVYFLQIVPYLFLFFLMFEEFGILEFLFWKGLRINGFAK